MSLLPNELEEMLGNKEEFEKQDNSQLVDIADEDLNEKLEGEFQEEMREGLDDEEFFNKQ